MSSETTYRVVRFYRDGHNSRKVIKTGLTLAEAQTHCKDPETSSSTCREDAGYEHTRRYGHWFDGYEKEST